MSRHWLETSAFSIFLYLLNRKPEKKHPKFRPYEDRRSLNGSATEHCSPKTAWHHLRGSCSSFKTVQLLPSLQGTRGDIVCIGYKAIDHAREVFHQDRSRKIWGHVGVGGLVASLVQTRKSPGHTPWCPRLGDTHASAALMRKLVSSYNHNSVDFTWQKNTFNVTFGASCSVQIGMQHYKPQRTSCCQLELHDVPHLKDSVLPQYPSWVIPQLRRTALQRGPQWRPLWYCDTFLHFRSPSTQNSNRIGIGSFRVACSVLLFAPCRAVIGLEWQAACTLKKSEPNSLDRVMVLDHLYLLQRMLSVKCVT